MSYILFIHFFQGANFPFNFDLVFREIKEPSDIFSGGNQIIYKLDFMSTDKASHGFQLQNY